MKRALFVALALLCALLETAPMTLPAIGAAPTSAPFPVSVAAQATSSGYTGAPTEAALEADFTAAAAAVNTTVANNMACWPLNDSIGTSTDFISKCGLNSDQISFLDANGNPNSAGFAAADPTPVLVTAADGLSVDFNSQATRMPTDGAYLPSSSSWTISAAMNNGGAYGSASQDLLNTGNPTSGTGFELYVNANSQFVVAAGNGSSASTLTSTATDTGGNASRIAFVTWNATSKVFTLYVYNEATSTFSAPQTLALSSFSAGNSTIGIVVPTSGSGTSPFTGNLAWISDIPAALSQTAVDGLITDMAGTQPPVATVTPNPNAPVTQLASQLANDAGFDTEFNFSSNAQDPYENQNGTSTRALHFMSVTQLRDSDNSASSTPYTQFCQPALGQSGGFLFSQGLPLTNNNAVLNASYITGRWDNVYNATGCYPGFTEPANEADDTSNSALKANDSHCSGNVTAPVWATDLVQDLHAMAAARASNPKYAGIALYGPGLQGANYDKLSAAQECYYGKTLFPVDVSIQHTGLVDTYSAPENATTGITSSPNCAVIDNQVCHVYALDPNGFSGYAKPGTKGYVPQLWDEWGEGYFSPYEPSGNAITQALAAHYMPRSILKIFSLGFTQPNDLDFLTDHVCDTAAGYSGNTPHNGCAFSQNGILDTRGNLKPPGYSLGNMMWYLGYANSGTRDTAHIEQLNFTVSGASANIAKYAVENDDGSYWIILVNGSEEGTHLPNGGNEPTSKGGTCTGTIVDANHLTGPCYNLFFQGSYLGNASPFTTVSINGLPSSITHAAVYQNDEYCNTAQTAVSTTLGTPYQSLAAGATSNRDCFQWWPAGSLQNSIQPSYPTITNGSITGLKYDGMPLLIHVSGARLNPIPTQSPMPDQALSTPGPSGSVPTQAPAAYFEPPTPTPTFGPPTGSVPTPPA